MYNLFNEKKKKNHHKFKLDVDGSSCSNPGRLGFGGLLRNEAGSWLMSFSGFAGVGTNLLPELQAIKHGLQLSWDQGFTKILCYSWLHDAIRLIGEDSIGFHKF